MKTPDHEPCTQPTTTKTTNTSAFNDTRDGASVGGGYEAETEVAVDGGDRDKGPEGPGLTEGGQGELGVEGIG